MTLPDVVDASVWYADRGLMAHVTVTGEQPITARKIQAECLEKLGVHQTPHDVFLIWANHLVA